MKWEGKGTKSRRGDIRSEKELEKNGNRPGNSGFLYILLTSMEDMTLLLEQHEIALIFTRITQKFSTKFIFKEIM